MPILYEKKDIDTFKSFLSSCVNVDKKVYKTNEFIPSFMGNKKQLCFLADGKAKIMKSDIDGNISIVKTLNENDIFSNLFFSDFNDDIFVVCEKTCTIFFVDYYLLLKSTNNSFIQYNQFILTLIDLLITDHKFQYNKIELLSQRSVRNKIMFFLKKRVNKNNIFKITTSLSAIAEYMVIDRSNFMRELKKMEDEKLIIRDKKTIRILF